MSRSPRPTSARSASPSAPDLRRGRHQERVRNLAAGARFSLRARVSRGSAAEVRTLCVARTNVHVPEDVAERTRAAGLDNSVLTRAAIVAELGRRATNEGLDSLPEPRCEVTHEQVMEALDAARDERSDHGAGCSG